MMSRTVASCTSAGQEARSSAALERRRRSVDVVGVESPAVCADTFEHCGTDAARPAGRDEAGRPATESAANAGPIASCASTGEPF